jgi:ribonuclease J
MTEAVKPKFLVPIHGEYRMLFRHKEFVKNHMGFPEANIILIENGDVLELDGERAAVIDRREVKRTFIDDSGFDEIDYETVRERKKMAYEGMVTLVVNINTETGELGGPPQIVAQGVRGFESTNGNGSNRRAQTSSYEGSKQLVKDSQQIVAAAIAGASRQTLADQSLLKEHLRVELKRFIQKETGARPVIVPVIQQV